MSVGVVMLIDCVRVLCDISCLSSIVGGLSCYDHGAVWFSSACLIEIRQFLAEPSYDITMRHKWSLRALRQAGILWFINQTTEKSKGVFVTVPVGESCADCGRIMEGFPSESKAEIVSSYRRNANFKLMFEQCR